MYITDSNVSLTTYSTPVESGGGGSAGGLGGGGGRGCRRVHHKPQVCQSNDDCYRLPT